MEVFQWEAWYEFFSINFNWIFGSIVIIILLLFFVTEKSSFSKSGWQTLGKGFLTGQENCHVEWYHNSEEGSAYWLVVYDD